MGTAADDARDMEEFWEDLWYQHKAENCGGPEDCPFCNPDFEPLFTFQCPREPE
jgi:hypothetical protein